MRVSLSTLDPRDPRLCERRHGATAIAAVVGVGALTATFTAVAYTATLTAKSPQTIYLQVGVGAFSNYYIDGGTPEKNTTVNTVSVTVPAAAVGDGTAEAMTTDSTAANSYWGGALLCTVPAQLYIGGFYRTTGATTAAAQVTATVPSGLTNTSGDSISFATVQWTSSGNGDTGTEPFPAGKFVSGGVQTVGSMASNTWNESCWTFSYLNTAVPASGTYTGVVLYTMTAP